MWKTDYHTLAPFVRAEELDGEVRDKLDLISRAMNRQKRAETERIQPKSTGSKRVKEERKPPAGAISR
jgi:hypothetical protein